MRNGSMMVWNGCTTNDFLDSEPFLQGIVFVDQERVLAGDPRRTLDLGDNRMVFADHRAGRDPAAEARPDQALVDERLILGQEAHRVDDGHYRRGASTAGRAIDFGVGEDG